MGRASHHSYTTIPARQVYMSHKTVREIFPYLAQGLSIVRLNCDFADPGIYMIGSHVNPIIM